MASGNDIKEHGKKYGVSNELLEFREHNFQPSPSQQNFRRDFSGQLARRRCGITLELTSFAYGEALRVKSSTRYYSRA